MSDRLTSKFKGFFKGDTKGDKVQEKPKRGVPVNKEELKAWMSAPSFANLERRGQEAFFKFLRGDIYREDEEIEDISVTADGVKDDARRYQFWLKCQKLELETLFKDYVMDDETKLPDAQGSYEDREAKVNTARDIDLYVKELKDCMAPDLNDQFSKFKVSLAEMEKTMDS